MQARSHSAGSGSVTGVTQRGAGAVAGIFQPGHSGARASANPESSGGAGGNGCQDCGFAADLRCQHASPFGLSPPREPTKSTPSEMSFRLALLTVPAARV